MARGQVAAQINGVWATILCDVSEDGNVNMSSIESQVSSYAKAGCDGVYCGGTASEIHLQTDEQFFQISATLAKAARQHHLPFQIGATHPLAQGTLDRVAFATTLSPLAIQVSLPDWTPLDFGSVQRFMARCAEVAKGTALVLYNPPDAKTVLTHGQLDTLCDAVPLLQGLKCGGGDADWYQFMAPVLDRISVFIPGHFYANGITHGAHGSYSNMACLSPSAAVAWSKMNHDLARDLEERVAAFMAEAIAPIIESGLPGFVADKAMAVAGGWSPSMTSRQLWPQVGASQPQIDAIVAAARKHIPEFVTERCSIDQPQGTPRSLGQVLS